MVGYLKGKNAAKRYTEGMTERKKPFVRQNPPVLGNFFCKFSNSFVLWLRVLSVMKFPYQERQPE